MCMGEIVGEVNGVGLTVGVGSEGSGKGLVMGISGGLMDAQPLTAAGSEASLKATHAMQEIRCADAWCLGGCLCDVGVVMPRWST